MTAYLLYNAGDLHSIIMNKDDAEKYLEDLRKAHPEDEWDIEERQTGRSQGHMQPPVWAVEAVFDLQTGELLQVERNWLWPSTFGLPELVCGIKVSRFQPCYGPNTDDLNGYIRKVKGHFSKYQVTEVLNEYEVIVNNV